MLGTMNQHSKKGVLKNLLEGKRLLFLNEKTLFCYNCNMNKILKLVIVGNGLDLHHGIKSSYQDFYETLPDDVKVDYNHYADSMKLQAKSWFDIEELFRKLIEEDLEVPLNNLVSELRVLVRALDKDNYDAQICFKHYYDKKWSDMVKSEWDFESRKHDLGYTSWEKIEESYEILSDIKLSTSQREEKMLGINKFFDDLCQKFLDYMCCQYPSAKSNDFWKEDNIVSEYISSADKILNFNYTNTLQDIYKFPKKNIIHLHGSLQEGNAILGHANHIEYMTEYNAPHGFGLDIIAPTLNRNAPNSLTHAEGDKCLARVKLYAETDFLKLSLLNKSYYNTFSKWEEADNRLEMEFEDNFEIIVLGHGLQSDVDLFSKFPKKPSKVSVFSRTGEESSTQIKHIKNLFKTENINILKYEWE